MNTSIPAAWAAALALSMTSCSVIPTTSERSEREQRSGSSLKYLQYTPDASAPRQGWPLVRVLHGAGERGDNLALVDVHGPTKHIFVTGGVVSSLGKGLTAASIGMLLEPGQAHPGLERAVEDLAVAAVDQGQALHPPGGVEGDLEVDHGPHGPAHEVRALDLLGVQDREDVLGVVG